MNRKRVFSRKQKRKSRGGDSSAGKRFFDQFDTKLRFRELEPRMVLSATAMVDGSGILQITADADNDAVTVTYSDSGPDTLFEVRDQNNVLLADGKASEVQGIAMVDTGGVHENQSLTLIDNSVLIDPNLSEGLIAKGIEGVTFQGAVLGDSFTVAKFVSVEGDTYDAEVNQTGADLLTPLGTPVTFTAINGASIDVTLESTANEISQLKVVEGGEIKLATSQDLGVAGSTADLMQLSGPKVELGADTLGSQFGALKIDLTAAGDIAQKGEVVVTGNTDLDVIGGKVLLGNANNDFQGAVSVNALNVVDADMATIADTNDLQLGDVRAANLVAITGGNLTQAAMTTVEVTDTVDFQFVTAGKTFDLQNAGNLLPSGDADFLLSGPETPENFYLRNDATDAAIPLAIRTLAGSGGLNDLTLIYTQNTTAIALPNIDITGDLVYQAQGVIAQDALTSIKVDGNASFKTLDDDSIYVDMADNEFNVISATGTTTANVVMINDNAGDLDLDQITAQSLDVQTVGTLGNVANAAVTVSGGAVLNGDTAIDLGGESGDSLTFGTLTFTSPGGVSIAQDSDTKLSGASGADSLTLESTGYIQNAANAEVVVANNATFIAGTGIALGNETSDNLQFGSLTFDSDFGVSIKEDAQTQLSGSSQAATLYLESTGAITNAANAKLVVDYSAQFLATDGNNGNANNQITLGDQPGDTFRFGSLRFGTVDAVSIAEDNGMLLEGTSNSGSLYLSSTAEIANKANAKLTVGGNAELSAGTEIDLGDETNDSFQFGSLTFAGASVAIAEDAATVLTGSNTATSLNLSSTDTITDLAMTSVMVSGSASLTAANAITLADDSDTLQVTGLATFESTNDQAISLGDATSSTQFGSLNFRGGAVAIVETDGTILSGVNEATSLSLSSGGSIVDAMTTSVTVTGAATFDAKDEILLANETGDLLSVGGLATFASADGDAITVGGANSTTLFGSLNFDGGVVTIQEDDATQLAGANVATSLSLTSGGSITDAMATTVETTGPATFAAIDEILLADQAGDMIDISDLATFTSADDDAITVGGASSTTFFGFLTFDGGVVAIQADGGITLVGTNNATSLDLAATGSITDAAMTSVAVTGPAKFAAKDEVVLANETDDLLSVSGVATFSSSDGDAITVGASDSTTLFGFLTFDGGAVSIQETDATILAGASSATSLNLTSGGSITDASMTTVEATGGVTLAAKDEILLANESGDQLKIDGLAVFTSVDSDAITVGGDDSTTLFGSLNFDGGAVTIQEDNATLLTGTNMASSLRLTSGGSITDASMTTVKVTGAATFAAKDEIVLANETDDTLDVTGLATFASADGDAITLGAVDSTTLFGFLTFDGGAVSIQETDATILTGANKATSLSLTSSGSITDASMTSVEVTGAASFAAKDEIVLANETDDLLNVGGLATFASSDSDAITVGDADSTTTFGSLNFDGGGVTIQEDDATQLAGANVATSLSLTSGGSITDAMATTVETTGPATFAAKDEILLADQAGDMIDIGDLATFTSADDDAITVGGASSTTFFGFLTFDGGVVAIQADDGITLVGTNNATSLDLAATGSITDASMTTVEVTGAATFTVKDEILLANEAGDWINVGGLAKFLSADADAITVGGADSTTLFGSLNVNGGAVSIQEDDATLLTGSNEATSLVLTSGGSIADDPVTSVEVVTDATFTAKDEILLADQTSDLIGVGGLATFVSTDGDTITVGSDDSTTYFGSLTFDGGAVVIREVDSTLLAGTNNATSLVLTSLGAITDDSMTSVAVTGAATFAAKDDIALANEMGDYLEVGGLATFTSSDKDAITVGASDSTTLFGSLTFDGGGVVIREDDATILAGSNQATSLVLTSAGSITDAPLTTVEVSGPATLAAKDEILLANETGDLLDVDGLATFASSDGAAITVGGDDSTTSFDLLRFSGGAVSIQEDDAMALAGTNSADSLDLISADAITDVAGTTIDVQNAATFTAGAAITLGDSVADVIDIGGQATFVSLGSGAIAVGGAKSTTTFASLNFDTAGAVVIQEDDSTQLTGANIADSVDLRSAGAITDDVGTTLDVADFATFTAATSITLADNATDEIDIAGLATFVSEGAGAIDVGVDTGLADGSDSGATVNFGQLKFVSDDGMLGRGAVTIREDSSTEIAGDNMASDLFLASGGSITDAIGTKVDATGSAVFIAQNDITLADNVGDELTIAGMATFNSLGGGVISIGDAGLVNIGMLSFSTSGGVVIDQDDAIQLSGDNVAGSLTLTSGVSITDKPDTTLDVDGAATFTAGTFIALADTTNDVLDVGDLAKFVSLGAGAIDVGVDTGLADGSDSGAMVDFGQLTFVSDDGMGARGNVTVREDSSLEVAGENKAADLFLASGDSITDELVTTIDATGAAIIEAQNSIALADTVGDELTIADMTTFVSLDSGAITIGDAGLATFGMLNFSSAGAVVIQEDDATQLAGDNVAGSLSLTSAESITDKPDTTIDVDDFATYTAGTFITLSDTTNDVLDVGGLAKFVSLGAGAIDVGVDVGLADGSDSGADVNFHQLTFVSDDGMLGRGGVTIREDSAMEITGDNKASDLFLATADALTDEALTSIDATGTATLEAQNEILLADSSGDVLHVGDLATFTSVSGSSITVGGDLSDTQFGSLTFNGGVVTIQEDNGTLLVGTNVASTLSLTSSGEIADGTGTSVMVSGDATFTAEEKITLAEDGADLLQAVGLAKFVSVGGATIDVGVDTGLADGSDSGATVNFGQLTFVSDNGSGVRDAVAIREDSDMEVTGVNLAASLFLAADGSIIQVEDGDALTADRIDLDVNGDGTVVGDAIFEAAAGGVINLFGDTTANPLGEPVTTFLAENKIQNAEFRAAGGDLADVFYRNVSTAALFPTLPGTITGDLRIQFSSADMIIDDDVNVGDQLILETLGIGGSISDIDGVSIAAQDGIFVAEGTISLADEAANSLAIDDNAFFYARGGDAITVGASDADGTASGATVEFGSLTFFSGDGGATRGDVVIHETVATELASRRFDLDGTPVIFVNQADSLVLISDGTLTDADSDGSMGETILRASVDVANSSVMIAGGEILLADQALVTVDGVDLGRYSLGLSDGAVDNDIALFATTTGDEIRVGVTDALASDSGALLEVDGLTFYSDGLVANVYLQIDSNAILANRDFAGMTYENRAADLVLRSSGTIGSAGGDTTQIGGDARFLANGDISLVNADPTGLLLVDGNTFFQSGGAVSVGTDTSGVNFGTLSFDAVGDVQITESATVGSFVSPIPGMTITDTAFAGGSTNHAGSLTLISDSFIEDADGTTVEVDTTAALTAGTTISLGNNAADRFVVGAEAAFISTGSEVINLGVTLTSPLATSRAADSGATVQFGALQVQSVGGDVTVHEDGGMLLFGDNQAGTLVLVANQGDLRDRAGTSVAVSNFAEFHAENNVVLADQATDQLTVVGNALFTSGNDNYFATPGVTREISIGVQDVNAASSPNDAARATDSGAAVSLGSVTFNGLANLDDGVHVTIREDESMAITHAERREGGGATEITNFAETAVLIADNVANDATITDLQIDAVGGTSIETTSYAVLEADSHIVLADEAADTLTIGDNAYFASQLGDIDLGVTAKAVNALDRGADSGASVQFGSLNFVADIGDVTIHEDNDTLLNNGNPLRDAGNLANSLVLESGGAIEDAIGTTLEVAELTTAPTAGSAEDQVDGLAILRAATDVHLGDSDGDAIDLRRLSLSVGGDVSITETSTTDSGLLLLDGSTIAGTLALQTDGHLVQINEERTGAAFTLIEADQALLVAGGGIVMTNVDFNTATLQAHDTLQVTPGATLNADDAANDGLLGRRTTDAISSLLPDSNDDTFAPKGPSTTPETQTNMDGAYSIVLSDANSLTVGLVTDAKGTIAADPVTLAFDVANSDDVAIADFTPAFSAVGVSAGHMFVQTAGDLNFTENGADPLDNVVVFGEVRMVGGGVANNAFTAIVGGDLNITGDSLLVMRSAADFFLFNPDNNTLTPFVGGALSDSVGSIGAVHSFATFVDVDTQPGFIEVGEFGPIYQRTAQSVDPDASTSQIAKGVGFGQFQVNATITQLGDSSTMDVNGQPVFVEQNQRVLVDWGDGSQSIYLFKDPVDGAQTLQHTYNSGFALTEQRATVTITVFNDPQINLYDNVVDETNFRDLNSVTDAFEVIIPVGVQFAPEPPPFEQPSAPELASVAFLPDTVFAVTTNSSFESDGGSLNQVQEVVVVIVNALDEEVGERIVLQGFSTVEEVKQYIQENTRFLPGRYKVSILLAGQQEPDVYYFEKIASDAPDGASGGAASAAARVEGYVRIDGPQGAVDGSAEQVWTAQYEKWFEADEDGAAEAAAPSAEEWTPDLSAALLREEQAEAAEEQVSLRRRWMLPGGIGGALMMAAYAMRPSEDQQRTKAVNEALDQAASETPDAKFSISRRRWRRRVR
ncbi:hypothetical protein [Blastopirellula retiformator]|uniref:Uncharacterized protein n=1 Tax=Blastopirellula retiformator TaxID=2527970 RepID=A0A5C5VNA2_9BACT|nr:hypothetical protein [Blastopirellula retiformator]TWT39371.1 hypothetical protein Enr8_10700 [Blastopirellula retiformator]